MMIRVGPLWKITNSTQPENSTEKKGTVRIVIKWYVVAIRKSPLASRTHIWQALLHVLATCAAMSNQYFSFEFAEGIKRGSSKRERERLHGAHSTNYRGHTEGAVPTSLLHEDCTNGHSPAQQHLGCSRVGKTFIKGEQYSSNCLCKVIIKQ